MLHPDDDRREFPRRNKQEKREYSRAVIRLETQMNAVAGERQVSGWTRDISVKGAYIMCAEHFPAGAKCVCRLALGEAFKDAPILEVSGWVVRCDDGGVAVQFTNYAIECFNKFRNFFGGAAAPDQSR